MKHSIGMFDKFDNNARTVIKCAVAEATIRNDAEVGTEHILFGLTEKKARMSFSILDKAVGVSLIREHLHKGGKRIRRRRKANLPLPFSLSAKRVLRFGFEESKWMDVDHVGSEHILLGLARETYGTGMQVLSSIGISAQELRDTISRALNCKLKVVETQYSGAWKKQCDALSYCRQLVMSRSRVGKLEEIRSAVEDQVKYLGGGVFEVVTSFIDPSNSEHKYIDVQCVLAWNNHDWAVDVLCISSRIWPPQD